MQKLVQSGDMIGEALVPYYRQILPILNIYKNKNAKLGDKIEYSQRKKLVLGDLIKETLELFEQTGGEVKNINLKSGKKDINFLFLNTSFDISFLKIK